MSPLRVLPDRSHLTGPALTAARRSARRAGRTGGPR
jgi:hypothetical protein